MTNVAKSLLLLVAASALSSCSKEAARRVAKPKMVPRRAVAWNQLAPIVSPDTNPGYLRVETYADSRVGGGQGRIYFKVHRPYDIYAADGRLLMEDVDNGENDIDDQPRIVALPAGRYVVATVYGATYRKVQVEVRSGTRTDVSDEALRDAQSVSVDLDASTSGVAQ